MCGCMCVGVCVWTRELADITVFTKFDVFKRAVVSQSTVDSATYFFLYSLIITHALCTCVCMYTDCDSSLYS